jgi:hypothetical protein
MSIHIACECGRQYNFKDEFAGKRAQCPACRRTLTIPAQTQAEVVDVAVEPEKGSKAVLIVSLCATGLVVLVGGGLLIWHFSSRGSSSTQPPVSPAVSGSTSPVTPSPVASVPLPIKPAVQPVSTDPPLKGSGGAPTGSSAKLTPAQVLVPFRDLRTTTRTFPGGATEDETKKRSEIMSNAHLTTIGDWVDWLGSHRDFLPSAAYLQTQISRKQVVDAFADQTFREERDDDFEIKTGTVKKTLRVTWLINQDVSFAINELGSVVAIRINDWPAAPQTPGTP